MALSVLVALMMLAVPLASSSNLFVDGGQTNSNGDAPLLGADESVEIIEVWIINDQTSLNKIGSYLTPEIQNTKYTDLWDKECIMDGPWIAVAFKALKAGEATVTVSNPNSTLTDNKYTFTKSNCTAGTTYVVTAYLDGKLDNGKLPSGYAPANGKVDALQIEDWSKFYTDDYKTTAKIDNGKVAEKTTNYLNESEKSYDVSFNLNDVNESGKKSLDEVKVENLLSGAGFTWYKDEDGLYHAIVNTSVVTVEMLVSAISNAVSKAGYTLDSWKDADGNIYSTNGSGHTVIDKNMTLSATWLLDKENYTEVPVSVIFDNQTTEYVKAYKLETTDKNKIKIDKDSLTSSIIDVAKLSIYGIVVNNGNSPVGAKVYSDGAVTYDNGKELPSDGMISSKSELTVTYVFDSVNYSKITVHSDAFKDGKDVTLYSLKKSDYRYSQVYDALIKGSSANGDVPAIKNAISIKGTPDKNGYQLTENGYLLKSWNNAERLDSTRYAPAELTLDSELSGYNIIFMANGQFEVVYVPYGELSSDKTKLDINGVNHWVSISYEAFKNLKVADSDTAKATNAFAQFNFSAANNVKTIEDAAKTAASGSNYNANEPIYVLIACFTPSSSTAYALFDANGGNFGNQYVEKIIIPGEANKAISLPSVAPAYEKTNVFLGYNNFTATGENQSKYGSKDTLIGYSANPEDFKYTITFYNGNDVNGIFYYDAASAVSDKSLETSNLVAFSYNGTAYEHPTAGFSSLSTEGKKAFNNILFPAKDGYTITQWKDADGNVMLDKVKKVTSDGETVITYEVKFKKVSSDMSFYANF